MNHSARQRPRSATTEEQFQRSYRINRTHVYGTVLERLGDIFKDRNLQPGDKLPSERTLAEMLAVSRVTVRQALKVLEDSGKVEIRHGSGTYLREKSYERILRELVEDRGVDSDFVSDLIHVRTVLDTHALRLFMESYGQSEIKELENIVNSSVEYNEDYGGSFDLRLESAFGRKSGNMLLAKFQSLVHELWVRTWTQLGIAPGDRELFHKEHLILLDFIRSGDVESAVELLRSHIDRHVDGAALSKHRRKPRDRNKGQGQRARSVRRPRASTRDA